MFFHPYFIQKLRFSRYVPPRLCCYVVNQSVDNTKIHSDIAYLLSFIFPWLVCLLCSRKTFVQKVAKHPYLFPLIICLMKI